MEKKKQGIVITSVLLVCLILVVIGVSFAFFTYSRQGSKENTITTGSLTFVYDEQKAEGNGITLSNAFPMSDDEGKQLSGSNNVFDFQVLASTKGESIAYEVIGKKDDASTLPENVTKIYLTTLNGSEESEVATTIKEGMVTTYDELSDTQIEDQTGKTLYQEVIPLNQSGYQKNFRLRMWLSEEANTTTNGSWDYNNKTFTIRINVVANGEGVTITTPSYTDTSGANAPELVEGMIPVVYDETKSSWVKQDLDKSYAYQEQVWANAVTVVENGTNTREYYQSAPAETVIPMEDINTMWVWVPRYEYQYTNLGTQYAGGTKAQPGEIQINFISKEMTSPSSSEYKVHPAFTFGGTELSGIWVGKFETTGTLPSQNYCRDESCNVSTVTIKPGVTSLRNQQVASLFYMTRSMQTNNASTYGFASDNSYNIHMAKNSEWGAVAYLSQSRYGKYGNPDYEGVNKEIYQNKSSSFITGSSNGTPSTESTNPQVSYDTPYSGYGASTTGTIYGIYDMSGGSLEYVMGNYNNITQLSGFSSLPEAKYYDLYTTEDITTACDGGICYGHALSETAGWYGDSAGFVNAAIPWFRRGGGWSNPAYAGVFYSHYTSGHADGAHASRAVLAQGA